MRDYLNARADMKIVFHEFFYPVYTSDPASAPGRMEAIINSLPSHAEIIEPVPATLEQIGLAHSEGHINDVRNYGLLDIASLAAGAAIETARIGLVEPAFGVIRPPGHHASSDSAWGFCFFNNMAIGLLTLKSEGAIDSAFVLDFDLHYGDGTANILEGAEWVQIHNPAKNSREAYLSETEQLLEAAKVDIIGISAGFDNHMLDWGGLLSTKDYYLMGRMVKNAAAVNGGGCFGILEGGYNHSVLGQNVAALINGLAEPAE